MLYCSTFLDRQRDRDTNYLAMKVSRVNNNHLSSYIIIFKYSLTLCVYNKTFLIRFHILFVVQSRFFFSVFLKFCYWLLFKLPNVCVSSFLSFCFMHLRTKDSDGTDYI